LFGAFSAPKSMTGTVAHGYTTMDYSHASILCSPTREHN
jgi:hypothetical protein